VIFGTVLCFFAALFVYGLWWLFFDEDEDD
jgi:hypothetical protein